MTLIRKRALLKVFAVFFLLEIITSIVAPAVSWALTSGPTVPEATSFEPVDTTDMVDLTSGDFNYTMPLLEVPGPAGGYPLSLSYHAGIMPNEDASWVGLGWTLNPGAITRNVNGFADDQKRVTDVSRRYWEGGETRSYSVGIGVGIAGTPLSVSANLTISQDTYRGLGIGTHNLKVGAQSGPFDASVGMSDDGYGDMQYGANVGLSVSTPTPIIGASASVGLSTNFKTVNAGYNAGVGASFNGSSIGAGIGSGSKGITVSKSIAGASFERNSRAGKINTDSHGWSVSIPVYGFFATLGYKYQRYWIDQTEETRVNGSLNYPKHPATGRFFPTAFDTASYDTYSLVDPKLPGGIVDHPESHKVMGGTFPNYDNYQVHAQGLFGAMRPYYYQKNLYRRNDFTDNDGKYYNTINYDLVVGSNSLQDGRQAEFRFLNDFSNRFEYTAESLGHPGNSSSSHLSHSFSEGTIKNGEDGVAEYPSNDVQGSRSITWFTNSEIIARAERVRDRGFIDTRATGFSRGAAPKGANVGEQIGGFTIVNESGVKYHFALPAYSYEEYSYSENIEGVEDFNEFSKKHAYAYTWFLTAVTGPDYVDRSAGGGAGDGILNEYDWGYWVEFDYGKWTGEFTWRNPSEGMDVDLDEKFQNFSEGKKEIYYLDAIRTKTHTALFVKDIRDDGKSTVYSLRNIVNRNGNSRRSKEIITQATKNGGFIPVSSRATCDRSSFPNLNQDGFVDYTSRPTSVMKLKEILLLQNKDLPTVLNKSAGIAYRQRYVYQWTVDNNSSTSSCTTCQKCDMSDLVFDHHLYQNVFDVNDVLNLASKAVRVVQFDTDQSLCPGTPNSFDYTLVNTALPSTNESDYPKRGKLALTGVQFKGKGGAVFMPPTRFKYDPDYAGTLKLNMYGALKFDFNLPGSKFQAGDIVRMVRDGSVVYFRITSKSGDNHKLKRMYGPLLPAEGTYTFQLSKNPPYNKNAFDIWGFYKSDHNGGKDNLSRLPSEQSARQVDAWSLHGVTSVTGAAIKIEYESDVYSTPELYNRNMLSVTNMELIPASKNVRFTFAGTDTDLGEIRSQVLNARIDLLVAKDIYYESGGGEIWCSGRTINGGDLMGSLYSLRPIVVTAARAVSVSGNVIEIHDPAYFDELYNTKVLNYDNSLYKGSPCTGAYNLALNPPVDVKSAVLVAGNLCLKGNIPTFGGGLRTRQLSVTDMDGSGSRTTYTYENGRTSFEPFTFGRVAFDFGNYGNGQPRINNTWAPEVYRIDKSKKEYQRATYANFSELLSNAIEVPAPGVMYGKVIVRSEVGDGTEYRTAPARQEYEFEAFTDDLIEIQYSADDSTGYSSHKVYDGGIHYNEIQSRNVTLRDYSSRVGNLKKVVMYNDKNEKLTETVSNYLHDGIVEQLKQQGYSDEDIRKYANHIYYESRLNQQYNNQGVTEETFTDAYLLRKTGDLFEVHATVTKREQYPSIQTGTTTINYKTGITSTSKILAFDYYSGQATRTLSKDGYGNAYVEEILPAYRKYDQMQQTMNHNSRNMLTQTAASVTYKVDPNNIALKVGVVSATIQDWSDQVNSLQPQQRFSDVTRQLGIWRKRSSYTFVGSELSEPQPDGSYKIADFTPAFNTWRTTSTINPALWQRDSEVTLYDVYSHALEAKDMNDDFAATRMSYDLTRVMATASNASYLEMGYANVEDSPAGGIFGSDVQIIGTNFTTSAHTGKRALLVSAGASAFVFPMASKGRTYRVSFWSTRPDAFVKFKYTGTGAEQSVPVQNKGKAGNWYLLEADFKPTAGSVDVWCGAGTQLASFDDFRVCPVDAAMISYVYTSWGEVSHVLDGGNLFTEYVYDNGGRLIRVNREVLGTGIIKVNETKYHYANQ